MKYLKKRRDSDTYAYQRKLPKELLPKAHLLGIKPTITWPLKLDSRAPQKQVAEALDECNERYQRLLRLLRSSDVEAVAMAHWEPEARALIESKGYNPGDLHRATGEEFLDAMEDILGVFRHQDEDPEYNQMAYDLRAAGLRIPEELIGAINGILTAPRNSLRGAQVFHLFSHAIDGYSKERIRKAVADSQGNQSQLKQKLREHKKEQKRLEDFLSFSGNQEFTSENANDSLKAYRKHLILKHPQSPATAKRNLNIPAAALRWYSGEVATQVSIQGSLKIEGQARNSRVRPVLDISSELPKVWLAAHDESYDHFFRLAVFGLFSGAHARELCLSKVEDVRADLGYYILGGTKTDQRRRPAVIVNEVHKELLLRHIKGSVIGDIRANQTESRHSKLLKGELIRATGNLLLTPYSLRHTGKHLANLRGIRDQGLLKMMFGWSSGVAREVADDYGRAGIYAPEFIRRMKQVTGELTQCLPKPL